MVLTLLVLAVLATGCMGLGGYQVGDIVSTSDKPGNAAYVILADQGDQYLKAYILTDDLGRWRLVHESSKKWEDKDEIHRYYDHKVGHVDVGDLWAF
jgi:hydrogenase maturation factor